MSLLAVQDLVSGYGNLPVLHRVSIEVEDNEMVALVGPNGAGKSTLLKAIFGLLPVFEGRVLLAESDISGAKASAHRHLGMALVPQVGGTFPDLSVEDNLRVSYSALDRVQSREALERAYSMFPVLKERSGQLARTLSGGERQMLTFVSGIGGQPRFLALDEPTAGLAPNLVHGLMRSCTEYQASGCAVLMVVEENPLEVLPYVDRVYVMRSGTIEAVRQSQELLDNADLQAMFFGTSG